MTGGDVINVYLNTINNGDEYTGGFYADKLNPATLYTDLISATINYYYLSSGGAYSFDGHNYAALPTGDSVALTTGSQQAVFASGTANGSVAEFTVSAISGAIVPEPVLAFSVRPSVHTAAVPEPGTWMLFGAGLLPMLYLARRRRIR